MDRWRNGFKAGLLLTLLASTAFPEGSPREGNADTAASRRAERYRSLYEAIMAREGPDGKRYGLEGIEPLLWNRSEFLLKGASHRRFLEALDEFSAQSDEALASYSTTERAILQRHLWSVFDWAAARGQGRSGAQRTIQRRLAPLIRRIALSRKEIAALPDTHAATAEAERYPSDPDRKKLFEPLSDPLDLTQRSPAFFPARLFEIDGPWVCLSSYPLITRTLYRAVFTVFARLPGGREATLEYFKELAEFRDPWGPPDSTEGLRSDPRTNLFVSRKTPQFPVGTRFALVRRALLIDGHGELVVSPLVERIQVRAYGSRLLKTAVAVFEVEPRKLMAGDATMRAIGADEPSFNLFVGRVGVDPFLSDDWPHAWRPPWKDGGKAELLSCGACHGGVGVGSLGSRNEAFSMYAVGEFRGVASLAPPRLEPAPPERTWQEILRRRRATYAWGLLEALWSR